MTKGERNFYFDVILGIVGITCIVTGIMMDLKLPLDTSLMYYLNPLHKVTGYIFTVLVGGHLIFHFRWVKALGKNILKNRKKTLVFAGVVTASIIALYLTMTFGPLPGPGIKLPTEGIKPTYFSQQF
ncbi:DUF4405 domain-containing protein [Carboxydothermus pertinax]|uniref:DUF4405 domain-containing protein n=1 Tax=Carboxydothermus pertinax TaxID=870242 RepID=A0A1L8CTB5_9THEO|nr:DUF4405 domain-containing protein [Carboxydothermus pertinax]GAV22185.1 hypothetical protein cpu_06950 [Carboxydothermus pertinax]